MEAHHNQVDKKTDDVDNSDLNVVDTYKLLLKIFKLRTIQLTVLVLITCKVTITFPSRSPRIYSI